MPITKSDISSLNFGSNQSAGDGLRALEPELADLGDALGFALDESETKGLRLARGLLTTAADIDQGASELGRLVQWASTETDAARAVVARSARLSGGGVILIDHIGRLPAVRAAPFIRSYFESGGEMRDIMEWLRIVGGTLRAAGVKPDGTAGVIVDAVEDVAEWVGDRAEDAVDAISEAVETVVDAVIDAGKALVDFVDEMVNWTVDQIADALNALIQAGTTLGEILAAAVVEGLAGIRKFVAALVDLGYAVVNILDAALDQVADSIAQISRALIEAGREVVDLVQWAAGRTLDLIREVVRGIIEAGRSAVSLIAELAQSTLELMRTALEGLIELGRTLAGLLADVVRRAFNSLEAFLRAALELGLAIADVVTEALRKTYAFAADVIKAALAAGITVAELLGEVVAETYWIIRKVVNGIIEAAGPVGEVLDWVLSAAEDFVGDIWHQALTALRYAGATMTEALDWALDAGLDALEAVIGAWESIREALIDVYEWAKEATLALGESVFALIGQLTVKIENSVSYVLGYLENDFIPGVRDFVTGLLEAGYAVADLVIRVVDRSVDFIAATFDAALDTGVALVELLVETVKNPEDIVQNVMTAVQQIGQSLVDIYTAVEQAVEGLIEDITLALHAIGTAVVDMLEAVLEVAGGLLGTVIAILLNLLGTFRPLTEDEKADARTVFEDALDLDDIYVSVEDLTNEIIFGIQDFFTGNEESRAFVTYNLINFDPDDGLKRHTLIHELTHVWQAEVTGPFYLSEAIHAQVVGDGYNYGYDEDVSNVTISIDHQGTMETFDEGDVTGLNGEAALQAAAGDFDAFNREQQGQITMHYFVRKILQGRPEAEWTDWQPYVDVVRAA